MGVLLDSNILIYATTPEGSHLVPLVIADDTHVADVTWIEVLGYSKITPKQAGALRRFART